SGRITCSRNAAASASQATTTMIVSVHCVRGAKSPSHSRARARSSPGRAVRGGSHRTRRSCFRRLPRRSETMPLEATIQRAARQPERLGGFTHVAARSRERFLDERPLDGLQAHLLERSGAVTRRAEREVARANQVTLGQEYRPLDRVVQLAHVAGPGVPEQRCRLSVTALGGRVIASLLYGVTQTHAPTLLLVGGVMVGVGALASWGPAEQAARISPASALRSE